MKPCPDRHETILLAVYDELNPDRHKEWEEHRTACPGCRDEYEALLRLLGRIRESVPVPELSEKRANSILWSVKRQLRQEREQPSWWRQWLVRPARLVPALATACLILITFGWFGMNLTQESSTPPSITGMENQAVIKDLDILANLDFLEDMDTLQELLNVLDRNDPI